MILMEEDAYIKFLRYVLRYANPYHPSSSWQETIGFLFGKFVDDDTGITVEITDVLPMDSGSSVYVKVGDYSTIYDVLIEKSEKGEFIVGWIHSHPGLSIFLSGTDVSTQKLYQQMDPRAVAIVVDPTTIKQNFPGLKAFQVNKNSYHPIDLQVNTTENFTSIYYQLKREISQILPPDLWKEEITVSLENITLNLEGPQYWTKSNKIIPLIFHYSVKEPGLQYLEFQPELTGARFYRRNKKIYRYNLFDKGLIAKFGIIPEENNNESIKLNLNKVNLFGKDGNRKSVENIIFTVKAG